MKQRYATAKDLRELSEFVKQLGEKLVEMAQWQALNTIQQNPYIYSQEMRDKILETNKDNPLLIAACKELFRTHPPVLCVQKDEKP